METRGLPSLIHWLKRAPVICLPILLAVMVGCQTPSPRRTHSQQLQIRRVRCLYEQRPWLNLDKAADRDPEGIRYRVFLDDGRGKGVLRDGTFHIELYQIDPDGPDCVKRTLVSDWHYPTSAVHTIAKPGMLGEGYFVHLRWADKDVAGHDIEIITCFEDPEGKKARSGTKRLRVPKYPS